MDMGVASIIVSVIGALVTLTSIFVSAHNTRSDMAHKLETNQQLQDQRTAYIENEIKEMKQDIKSHNNYAKLFSENIPVIQEQIKVANHRIEDLEHKVDKVG